MSAVRRRPSMYLGGTDPGALAQLVWQLVEGALDGEIGGQLRGVAVKVNECGVSVTLDGVAGPDAPLPMLSDAGHAMPYFPGAGWLAIPFACVLSSTLVVTTDRGGRRLQQVFQAERPVTPLVDLGQSDRVATMLWFTPDSRLFPNPTLDVGLLHARFVELAHLVPDIRFTLNHATLDGGDGLITLAVGMAEPAVQRTHIDEPRARDAVESVVRAALRAR